MTEESIDILDKLQNVDGYVRLVLKSGEIMYGKPDCIVHDEDEEGWETIRKIRFEPVGCQHAKYFMTDEIESFNQAMPYLAEEKRI